MRINKGKMLILLGWIATLNDNNVYSLAQKLTLLTIPAANIFLIITVFLTNIRSWFNLLFVFCALWLFIEVLPTLALTNTLFVIHPIMLYAAAISTLRGICRRPLERGFYIQGIFFALAITLGGVWSMQELNWGGWWNWDVLEMGIAQIWIIAWFSSHTGWQKSSKVLELKAIATLLCTLMYYYLNKLGIAVSIHSFITSESLRLNAQAILVLWCIILFNMCSRLNLLSLISLTIIYGKAVTVDALKICTLFIALVILTKFSFFKGKLGVYHSIFLSIVIGATIINYTNIGISMTESRHTLIITTSLGTRPLTAYNIHTFIWDDNWLSKPNSRFNSVFSFHQMRSQHYNVTVLAYKK